VHSVIDDHSRLAYSEILSDEKGITCAAFLQRAADYFATYGITQIERIMTDNAWAYRYSLREVVAALGARQVFIKPHC
jgi:Integrase core domain